MQRQVFEMFDLCFTNETIARVLDLPMAFVLAMEQAYVGAVEAMCGYFETE